MFMCYMILAYNRDFNTPLANLYLSMLQNMGVETDRFASSTGTLTRLYGS